MRGSGVSPRWSCSSRQPIRFKTMTGLLGQDEIAELVGQIFVQWLFADSLDVHSDRRFVRTMA
jgi:hypothetical protein